MKTWHGMAWPEFADTGRFKNLHIPVSKSDGGGYAIGNMVAGEGWALLLISEGVVWSSMACCCCEVEILMVKVAISATCSSQWQRDP